MSKRDPSHIHSCRCIKTTEKFMLTGGTPAAAGGPRQSAETGVARADTLGPDGGQRTWKPGPGGAAGPTDAKESAHSLFPSGMLKPGKGAGARGGGPRGMGEEVGRPGAGARHENQPQRVAGTRRPQRHMRQKRVCRPMCLSHPSRELLTGSIPAPRGLMTVTHRLTPPQVSRTPRSVYK